MSDNPEIFSKRLVRTNYPLTVVKGKTMKSAKTPTKGKVTSVKKLTSPSAGLKKVGNNLKNETVKMSRKA